MMPGALCCYICTPRESIQGNGMSELGCTCLVRCGANGCTGTLRVALIPTLPVRRYERKAKA